MDRHPPPTGLGREALASIQNRFVRAETGRVDKKATNHEQRHQVRQLRQ